MRYRFDHDYHIHSNLSTCSRDPEQTTQRILQYAKENGLHTICLTDHFWDATIPGASNWYVPQNYSWISQAKPLPQTEGVEFLFGCETEIRKDLVLGLAQENFSKFDFVVIPTTHLHFKDFTIALEDMDSLERRKQLWLQRLDAILDMPLPFHKVGIAHLTCGLTVPKDREGFLSLLHALPGEELERLFNKAAEKGVGIELNAADMSFADGEADCILRPYRIAKACGCKFYCGSDVHQQVHFSDCKEIFDRAINMLNLQESDKFHMER